MPTMLLGRLLPETAPIFMSQTTKLRTILDTEALLQPRQQLEEGELLVIQISPTLMPLPLCLQH